MKAQKTAARETSISQAKTSTVIRSGNMLGADKTGYGHSFGNNYTTLQGIGRIDPEIGARKGGGGGGEGNSYNGRFG